MTSVSGYKVYKAKCCGSEVRLPIYASVNSSTIFAVPRCECETVKTVEDLEFVCIDRPKFLPLSSGGVDNYEIPAFLRKQVGK
jgi:hypothetical protein